MRLFELESDENTVYFAFVNSNPPTFGYKRALDTIDEISKNSDHVVFINPAYDGDNFPLKHDKALSYNKKIFPNTNFYTKDDVKNPIQALKYLSDKYSKIYFLTRDKSVNDYRRLYQYAENWGVESFDIIGLGDSSRPLPTGTSKTAAMDAVMDNDYESFKSTIPNNNSQTLSNLFIDLRKEVIDEKNIQESTLVDMYYDILMGISSFSNHTLCENSKYDELGNEVLVMENFVNCFKNLKLVLSDKFNGTKAGVDGSKNYVILMNTNTAKLQQYVDMNEHAIKKALQYYIDESITSGSIASSVNVLGSPISRDIDYTFVNTIKKSKSFNKQLDAINHVINNYGFIDRNVINTINSKLSQ